ncbi:hypothetical protein HDU96_003193 [Phlyctochytrium bullatum]|nr:hypothetical protein HDU96_003193 [Phlyctochytrium bullatum]
MSPVKFYELIYTPADAPYYTTPNTWKVRLSLLHKKVPFETKEIDLIGTATELSAKRGSKATVPALEFDDGSILCDSFKIAEYLEKTYPDAPSLFTGTSAVPASEGEVALGKAYARLVDLGLGNSGPQWAVWYDIIAPEMLLSLPPGPNRDYIVQDSRHQPGGFQWQVERRDKEDLIGRAKLNVQPLITILKERPGEFFQGKEPGFADFVLFGRYAMCRNSNPKIGKEIWDDQGVEIVQWVERMLQKYPEIKPHIKPY